MSTSTLAGAFIGIKVRRRHFWLIFETFISEVLEVPSSALQRETLSRSLPLPCTEQDILAYRTWDATT